MEHPEPLRLILVALIVAGQTGQRAIGQRPPLRHRDLWRDLAQGVDVGQDFAAGVAAVAQGIHVLVPERVVVGVRVAGKAETAAEVRADDDAVGRGRAVALGEQPRRVGGDPVAVVAEQALPRLAEWGQFGEVVILHAAVADFAALPET